MNSSKLYRQERKARKEKRQARIRKQGVGNNRDSSSSPPSSYNSSQNEEDVREADDIRKRTKGKQIKQRRLIGDLYTDMYKMFDGSAMMALGEFHALSYRRTFIIFCRHACPGTCRTSSHSTYSGNLGVRGAI